MEKQRHASYRAIPPADFAALGVQQIAYIKPVRVDAETGVVSRSYAIHAADGTQVMVVGSRDAAWAAVIQNDMAPVSVH